MAVVKDETLKALLIFDAKKVREEHALLKQCENADDDKARETAQKALTSYYDKNRDLKKLTVYWRNTVPSFLKDKTTFKSRDNNHQIYTPKLTSKTTLAKQASAIATLKQNSASESDDCFSSGDRMLNKVMQNSVIVYSNSQAEEKQLEETLETFQDRLEMAGFICITVNLPSPFNQNLSAPQVDRELEDALETYKEKINNGEFEICEAAELELELKFHKILSNHYNLLKEMGQNKKPSSPEELTSLSKKFAKEAIAERKAKREEKEQEKKQKAAPKTLPTLTPIRRPTTISPTSASAALPPRVPKPSPTGKAALQHRFSLGAPAAKAAATATGGRRSVADLAKNAQVIGFGAPRPAAKQ